MMLMQDNFEDNMQQYFRDRPRTSTRTAVRDLGLSNHVNVWRVQHRNNLHLYRFQKIQDSSLLTTTHETTLYVGATYW